MLTAINNIEKRLRTLRSSSLPTEQVEKVASNLRRGDANWRSCIDCLRNEIEERDLANLDIANSVAEISDENIPLVSAIVQDDEVFTLKEFALKYNLGKLTQLLSSFAAPTLTAATKAVATAVAANPDAIPESIKETARSIRRKLFDHEPTGVLCSMIEAGEFPVEDKSVRATVASVLKESDDIRTIPMARIDALTSDLAKEQKAKVGVEVDSLRRLITYGVDAAPVLKKANLTSSFAVSRMSKDVFVRKFAPEMGEAEANRAHNRAMAAVVHYNNTAMIIRDAVRGSGLAIVDGTIGDDDKPTKKTKKGDLSGNNPKQPVPFNLEELFSDNDTCECDHCSSVYSAAAYYVELLEFLRSGNMPHPKGVKEPSSFLDAIEDTALGKLLRRRPDLAELELTCENTNTVLPYIDLCNEVMESYITHLDRFRPDVSAVVDVYNVGEKTQSSTLLAAPENTKYKYEEAYGKLSTAVYPFSLPYHQPIDEARIFLEYLEANRDELLNIFRAKTTIDAGSGREEDIRRFHREAQERAFIAESLGLTQEQYIILTEEGFYPREFYEACGSSRTPDEYRKDIRVHEVHEYYGYSKEAEMLDRDESHQIGLTFVKKQFLPRSGVLYEQLVELLKTRYINPRLLEGKALAFLKKIDYSYRFLQTLVDGDDKSRLIRFLKDKMPCQSDLVEEWVNEHFDNIGELIVLESGGPVFSIKGSVFARLESDGTRIWEQVGELQETGQIVDGATVEGIVTGELNAQGFYPVINASDPEQSYFAFLQEDNPSRILLDVQVRQANGVVLAKITADGILRERLGLAGRVINRVGGIDTSIGELNRDGTITRGASDAVIQVGYVNDQAAVFLTTDATNRNANYVPLTQIFATGEVFVLFFENDDIAAKVASEMNAGGTVSASRLVQPQLQSIENERVQIQSTVEDNGVTYKELGTIGETGIIRENTSFVGKVRVDNSVVDFAGTNFFDAFSRREIEVREWDSGSLKHRRAFITSSGLRTGEIRDPNLPDTGNEIRGKIFDGDDSSASEVASLSLDGNIRNSANETVGLVDTSMRVFANDSWFCTVFGRAEFFVKTASDQPWLAKIVARSVEYKRLERQLDRVQVGVKGILLIYKKNADEKRSLESEIGYLNSDGRVVDNAGNLVASVANDRGTDVGQVYRTDGTHLFKLIEADAANKQIVLVDSGEEIGEVIATGLVQKKIEGAPPTLFAWKTTTRVESILVVRPKQIIAAEGILIARKADGSPISELGSLHRNGNLKNGATVLAQVAEDGVVTTPGGENYFERVVADHSETASIWITRNGLPVATIQNTGVLANSAKLFAWGDNAIFDWVLESPIWKFKPYEWRDEPIALKAERVPWLHWDRCDLDIVRLQHLDGESLTVEEYGRLHLLIRLWRILGWSIPKVGCTQDALGSLTPPTDRGHCFPYMSHGSSSIPPRISPYFLQNLVYVKKIIEQTGAELDDLLVFWGDIGTFGEESLYSRLFLTHNIRNFDPVFEPNEDELFLAPPYELINEHIPVLMAALRLTADELQVIQVLIETRVQLNAGRNVDDDSVQALIAQNVARSELTPENASAIYRHKLLADALGIKDLFYLQFIFDLADKNSSEVASNGFATDCPFLDPNFGDPFAAPLSLWNLLEFWREMENAGLSFEQLVYVVLGDDHPTRKVGILDSSIESIKKSMYDAVTAINEKHKDVVIADEDTFSTTVLQEKLALWYEAEIADGIVGLLENSSSYVATNGPVSASAGDIVVSDDLKTFLTYEWETGVVRSTQVLTEADRDSALRLSRRLEWQTAVKSVYNQPRAFFDRYVSSFFDEAQRDSIRATLLEPSVEPKDKRRIFLETFVPYLRIRLRKEAIVSIAANGIGLNEDTCDSFLRDILTFTIPAHGSTPAVTVAAIEALDESLGANPSYWKGKLVAPASDEFSFFVQSSSEPLPIVIGDEELPFQRGEYDPEGFFSTSSVKLISGKLYKFSFQGDIVALKWKTPTSKLEPIPTSVLVPMIAELEKEVFFKLARAAILTEALELTAEDIRYWHRLSVPDPKDLASTIDTSFDFNSISLTLIRNLFAYAELRDDFPKKEKTLLEFFQWSKIVSSGSDPIQWPDRVLQLTDWKKEVFDSLTSVENFDIGIPQYFTGPRNFRRVRQATAFVNRTGVHPDDLFQWASPFLIPPSRSDVVSGWPKASFDLFSEHAKQIRSLIKARHNQTDWESLVRPLNNKLRTHQRNALADYLVVKEPIRRWGVTDIDSLFEFLLIDPQMDACLETSRIKQAISSVQLFIHRAMLGLEEKHGIKSNDDVLDRDRWEWMQKYRVWEANRKVFLYPENWIRSELRDDKSPLYKDFESELLQTDISPETAENLVHRYLSKLDEISNLQPVGLFYEKDKEILHVVSRTRNSPQAYYYRNLDIANSEWTPWEHVSVDIPTYDSETISASSDEILKGNGTGTFVIPVVYNSQLFLFFPIINRKTKENSSRKKNGNLDGTNVQNDLPTNVLQIKLAWSERQKDKWTAKQVSVDSWEVEDNVNNPSDDYDLARQLVFIPRIFPHDPSSGSEQILISITRSGSRIGDFSFKRNHLTKVPPNANHPADGLPTDAYHFKQKAISSFQAERGAPASLFDRAPKILDRDRGNTSEVPEGTQIYYPQGKDLTQATRPFWHSFVNELVNQAGAAGNLDRMFDVLNHVANDNVDRITYAFGRHESPTGSTSFNELKMPYSLYNWELGFHIPMFLAERMIQGRLFDPAIKMLRYVLDPFAKPGPDNTDPQRQRFWKFYPFKKTNARDVLDRLFIDELEPRMSNQSITEWRDKPFRPHVVARSRPSAYMKWTAMKYIELLIEYGDYYFRQNSLETLQLAIQMYVMAAHAYGPKGQHVPSAGKKKPESYRSLAEKWDAFGNAMVKLETKFPFSSQTPFEVGQSAEVIEAANVFGFAGGPYFCIPNNPDMAALREKIDDRLFKIRHCQDIDGNVRKLPLFDPPIDPALLVQAVAQGLSIASVLNDLNAPMPNYRFSYLLQKALELCNELKSLGANLLSAKEKKDAEILSKMRAKHEVVMNDLVMSIRKMQLQEAEKSLENLEQNRRSVTYRMKHFLQLVGEDLQRIPQSNGDFSEVQNRIEKPVDESELKLVRYEKEQLDKASESASRQVDIGKVETLASVLHVIPSVTGHGTPLGCGVAIKWGPAQLANAASAVARYMRIWADNLSFQSSRAATKGGFLRQLQERIQQANVAGYEIKNIDGQILSHRIRIDIARKEIDNHQKQIDHSKEVQDYLKNKYSNEELYTWMESQLKTLYYQTYSLASDIAKKAEKTFRFERGLAVSEFIQSGYWESGRDGLLVGERLFNGLKQLEAAYQENRGYDFEITKSVSLRDLNPLALAQLRQTGICEFAIPESNFDMDYPGHYKRRIKSVSLSIPAVVGPHTSLNCTLSLLGHKFRYKTTMPKGYAEQADDPDRFMTTNVPINSIATSTGQNDSGVFELNFKDERYLPFEGAGAISSWRLELPKEIRQFDYGTIADVILHVKYTSVNGGEQLKNAAAAHIKTLVEATKDLARDEGLFVVLDLPHDYSTQWPKFAADRSGARTLDITQNIRQRIPFYLANEKNASVKLSDLILVSAEDEIDKFDLKLNGVSGTDVPFGNNSQIKIKSFAGLRLEIASESSSQAPLVLSNETTVSADGKKPLRTAWALLRLTFKPSE